MLVNDENGDVKVTKTSAGPAVYVFPHSPQVSSPMFRITLRRYARAILPLFLLLPCSLLAQQPASPGGVPAQNERDLKTIKPGGTAATAADVPVTIPRSYALVVGISHYANLPASAQLHYPGRDAEEMYTTLISPEGGQFPPENGASFDRRGSHPGKSEA